MARASPRILQAGLLPSHGHRSEGCRSADRNKIVLAGWRLREITPPLFSRRAAQIAIGILRDSRIAEADWIIEVVRRIWRSSAACWQGCAICKPAHRDHNTPAPFTSSRKDCPKFSSMGRQHFFNPPRYMKLVEFIPARDFPDVVAALPIFATGASQRLVVARTRPTSSPTDRHLSMLMRCGDEHSR